MKTANRPGIALIIVLFITMVIVVLSLGYLAKSDVELACGKNMSLRANMDYLAESALEHARGLILNPQELETEYFTGATAQQLIAGSSDYYDVTVTRDDSSPTNRCNYNITAQSYRIKNAQQIGQSSLQAELRLDPVITYWQNDPQPLPSEVAINGDIHNEQIWLILGDINGDIYSTDSINDFGDTTGQIYPNLAEAPIAAPGLDHSDFSTQYYHDGSGPYYPRELSADTYDGWFPTPGSNNPARIYYRDGNLTLKNDITINGSIIVKNDLKIDTINTDITIVPVKNSPALIVGHNLTTEEAPIDLSVTGYVQIGNHIDMKNKTANTINISGALYILGDGIQNTTDCSVTLTAYPDKAALEIWTSPSTSRLWSPATGAFYKSIQRP